MSGPTTAGLDATVGDLAERRTTIAAEAMTAGHVWLTVPPLAGPEDFARVRDALLPKRASYVEGATPRTAFGSDVFSSTDVPASREIRPHNENSYATNFPGHLLFACLEAPEQGGATTTCDVRAVLRSIDPAVVADFRRRDWALVRNYSAHISRPWQEAFGTEVRDEVDAYCAEHGVIASWHGERLQTRQVRPVTVAHPISGVTAWFNHIVFWHGSRLPQEIQEVLIKEHGQDWPFRTTYGDGGEIPDDVVDHLAECYRTQVRARPWEPGLLLLVDNLSAAHGRESFRGGRKVVVAMGTPLSRAELG